MTTCQHLSVPVPCLEPKEKLQWAELQLDNESTRLVDRGELFVRVFFSQTSLTFENLEDHNRVFQDSPDKSIQTHI